MISRQIKRYSKTDTDFRQFFKIRFESFDIKNFKNEFYLKQQISNLKLQVIPNLIIKVF